MSFIDQIKQQVLSSLGQANPKIANLFSTALAHSCSLNGLMEKFKQGGLLETMNSWIISGKNMPSTVGNTSNSTSGGLH